MYVVVVSSTTTYLGTCTSSSRPALQMPQARHCMQQKITEVFVAVRDWGANKKNLCKSRAIYLQ